MQLESLLDDYLDYTDLENLGIKNNFEQLEISNNMYQNLYNYISNKSSLFKNISGLSCDDQYIESVENNQNNYSKIAQNKKKRTTISCI